MIPVILSGGAGTRLWPLSRQKYPKQFLPVVGDNSLFHDTLARLQCLPQATAPLIICNHDHRFLVAEQLRLAQQKHAGILLEPCARNTAPAVTLAALQALGQDQDALLLVLPADHVIKNVSAFQHAVATATQLAQQGKLVTFGIVPEYAETGYGYVRQGKALAAGAAEVAAFVEKPDAETAQRYVSSGDYLWNSGMFLFRADGLLAEMRRFQPAVVSACELALAQAYADLDFIRLNEAAFAASPDISLDYAVMEHTNKAAVVSLDAGWSDVGAWDAVWRAGDADADAEGNVARGDVMLEGAKDNLVYAGKRLVCLLGVQDLVVVDTDDALLVADKAQVQEIKAVVKRLQDAGYSQVTDHREVHRPWGSYDCIDAGSRFQVKRIRVKPGAALSLQKHYHRAEHWVVVRGTAEVTCEAKTFLVHENQSVYIPVGAEHRLVNPGKVMLDLIEVQSGGYLGEDDIVRLDDVYGREAKVTDNGE